MSSWFIGSCEAIDSNMRHPSMQRDRWQLISGDERHAEAPTSFEIPELAERQNLRPGQGVKLIFEIESRIHDGKIVVKIERMWVTVLRREGDDYVGVLESQPHTTPKDGSFYLGPDCEVPFLPMHVIAITDPPPDFQRTRLATPPSRRWI
jgi:hypothetical protein